MKLLKFIPNVQGFTLNYNTNMTRKKFNEKMGIPSLSKVTLFSENEGRRRGRFKYILHSLIEAGSSMREVGLDISYIP